MLVGCIGKWLARLHALYLHLQDNQLLPEVTPELPSGLRRRLWPTYLFLVAYSATGLGVVEALAPGLALALAALRSPRADPPLHPLLSLNLPWQ